MTVERRRGLFTVGVFEYQGTRRVRLTAYTRWYNPSWSGCCEHLVLANNGTEAKQRAMTQHREQRMRVDADRPDGITFERE